MIGKIKNVYEPGKEEKKGSMKKKYLMMLAVMLLLSAAMGTTYAYLTARDDVENMFDVAEVKPTVEEDFEPEPPEPGKVIKKAPKVQSNSDTDCYVRIRCVFSDSDAEALCEPIEINPGWTWKSDGYYYWENVVRPGEETGTLFDYVKVKEGISKDDIIPFDILVYTEAVQAKGKSAEEAWASMN